MDSEMRVPRRDKKLFRDSFAVNRFVLSRARTDHGADTGKSTERLAADGPRDGIFADQTDAKTPRSKNFHEEILARWRIFDMGAKPVFMRSAA